MATYGTFADGVPLKASELNSLLKWASFSGTTRQSVTLNKGPIGLSRYATVNKTVFVAYHAVFFSDGTEDNPLEVDLPITAATSNIRVVGSGYFNDLSFDGIIYNLRPVLSSTTTLQFLSNTGTSLTSRFGVNPDVRVSGSAISEVGDALSFGIMYEAA